MSTRSGHTCQPETPRHAATLSQEAIAFVTVDRVVAGLNVTRTHRIRSGMQALHAEAGADREAFGKHVTRLTQSLPPA